MFVIEFLHTISANQISISDFFTWQKIDTLISLYNSLTYIKIIRQGTNGNIIW